ncbi:unnamed protein product [Camellia sinensis]
MLCIRMKNKMSLLMFLLHQFLMLFLSSSSSTSAHHTCLEDQRFSLLQFKRTFTITPFASFYCFSDSHPKMVFWNESTDCCSWEGVTCDWLNGHVIGLDLSCSQLQGTIQDNSTLFHLRHLQSLNLAFNYFSLSRISSEFGSFASLTYLNLSYSGFEGPIPSKTSHLSKLISLDLSYVIDAYSRVRRLEQHTFNMLLRNLTQLRELHLDALNIFSPLPHALLNLYSLTSLSLGNVLLTGKLPYFNVASSLQFLDLSDTSFSGQLPESISNLKALNISSLIQCDFTGSIPASFGYLTQITKLDFWSNNFSGQVPSSISNLAKLNSLYLSTNNLNGQIPDSLGNMSQLTNLYLSGNNLNRQRPDSLGNMSQLTTLDLFGNQLTSTIPSSLFALPSLINIDLSDNKLQGPIPGSVYELQNLTDLVLSSNNLSGVVDLDKLLKLKNLYHPDLSYNGLSLNINNSVNSTLTNFHTIGLASCNLSAFPNFLREQAGLRSLDLSNNKIHGEVPKWLFHKILTCTPTYCRGPLPISPNATIVFSISNNKLSGEIPPLICGLSSLQVLDLSNNSLSGLIPQCLGNLSNSLSVLNLGINSFSGTFTATFTRGNILRNLNLNGNQIEGQVPPSLLNCECLEVLDLGKNKINDTFNRFHGHIGTSKTKGNYPFPKLRIIDISCNEFTGLLPTNYIKQFGAMMNVNEHVKLTYMGQTYYQDSVVVVIKGNEIKLSRILTSIGRLNSLRGLNLSHNNLEGHIPTSLGNLKNLESLDLSSNKFVGEIPQQLKSLTFLEWLFGGIFTAAFAKGNMLRSLNLNDNKIEGHVLRSLLNCRHLQVLDLGTNKINDTFPR